jgi:hypothetical protein
MDILTYNWDIRQGVQNGTQIHKHQRKYIDFIVSGHLLSETFETKNKDMISSFGWSTNIEYENRTIKEFLKQEKTELETGRTILYCCAECGDIGCGAITTEIIETEDKIIWRNFAYENGSEETDFNEYKNICQFEFDKEQYANEFHNISEELAETER